MLRSIKELKGYGILALDDTIGQVHDFLFDDFVWQVRYMVADTGTWLPGRRVLISPLSLGKPDWEGRLFPVNLTREQIENSPDLDADQPVSRQHEVNLAKYYEWPTYWHNITPLDAGFVGMHPRTYLAAREAAAVQEEEQARAAEAVKESEYQGDPHLRSVDEVTNYNVQAVDGEIGHISDFIVDDETWAVQYLVISTGSWFMGKEVLLAPQWIERVIWDEKKVFVALQQETIKNSPEYDPTRPVNREYETQLYDYYGRPYYWK